MFRWIFMLVGLAFGWDEWDLVGGLILAVLGFVFGQWLDKRNASTSTASHRPVNSIASELQQLKRRVSQLEAEMAQLKGMPSPAEHTTSATASEPTPISTPIVAAAETAPPPLPHGAGIIATSAPAAATAALYPDADPAISTPQPAAAHPRPPLTNPVSNPVSEPGALEQGLAALKNWFLGGNTVVRLGMLILFFGVSFLLKFAADNQMLPIEVRLAGLSLGAALIFTIGWRLRESRRSYALIMQGGALGLLYFTVYGAMKLYQLLPTTPAFVLLALLGLASAILAIRQDASALAFMGISGGFLAPILTSDGSGNHVLLFAYFALLNAGIFAIAWFKAWRSLNLLGFVFTYVIALLWGVFDYRSEHYASTQPFVMIFWLFFAGISTLYAIRRSHTLASVVDGTLVFGTPIATLALQAQILAGVEYGMCYSALVGATFYLALAAWLHARRDDSLRLFTEAQLAIGVLLATLAIPLAFDGNVTAAMWALEGACVVWVSLRQSSQQRRLALVFGLLLQFGAGLAVIISSPYYTPLAFLNGVYLADLLLALSGLFCAWQLHEKQPDWASKPILLTVGWLLGGWGLLWWGKANLDEIARFLDGDAIQNAHLLLLVLTAAIFQQFFLQGWWRNAKVVAIALGPILLLIALEQFGQLTHYFALWAWLIALAALFALLYQQDDAHSGSDSWQHTVAAWLVWGIFSKEIIYLTQQHIHSEVFELAAFALLISAAVAAVKYLPRPIRAHWRAYWVYGTAPMALVLLLWGFYSALSGGSSGLPLLNALDLAQLAALAALVFWLKPALAELEIRTTPRLIYAVLGLAVFVWLNAMLLRTLHHQAEVAYTLDALRHSTLVQMSLSIFWTIIALALMLAATRSRLRVLWLIGAGLLGIVIGKLFLLDLSNISGIERIGSFMGVGVLLLLIGYFAPLPPNEDTEAAED
ncbi:DUF2339 domain-containing protein [Chitinibacter sp. GC72]|uniref:DUF2339 domain-containing protein n=1 Tax=Chitinibacter sp. GC72 TaxID=1526917 RepID=UPI0012F9FBE6|nr:DUF2339 domain-containing protein [Chitinibacter sp. GC72]